MQTLGQIIGDSRNVLICTHRAPDGDAIGSSLAWAQYLKKLDKDVNIAVPDMYPDFLQWLPGCNRIFRFDKKPEEVAQLFKNADLLCCLDFNSSSRTDDMKYLIDSFTEHTGYAHYISTINEQHVRIGIQDNKPAGRI